MKDKLQMEAALTNHKQSKCDPNDSDDSTLMEAGSHSKKLKEPRKIIRKFRKLDVSELTASPAPDVKIGQRVAYKEYYGNEFGTIRWIGKFCAI